MDDTKPPFTFEEFAYEIIHGNPKAKLIIKQIELMLMQPVFIFGKDPHYSSGNEGRNILLRNLLSGADKHLTNKKQEAENKGKPKSVTRKRKAD